MSNPLSVGVLVTAFNAPVATTRSLNAILSSGGADQIVVIDDGSARVFKYPDERVRIIRNESNIGYVNSVNLGFAALNTDIVILLDCDAYVIGNVVERSRELFAQNERLGLAGFSFQDETGRPTGSGENEPTVWSLILGQRLAGYFEPWLAHRSAFVFYSCAVAIRRQCFTDLGGFDVQFDFLDADIDFSMRVNRSTWQAIGGDPGLRAVHDGHGSPQSTAKRVIRFHANRYKLLVKHGMLRHPRLTRLGVIIRTGAEIVILNTLFLLDRTDRRSQQREARYRVLRYFQQIENGVTDCLSVKRSELGWIYADGLACIHRACRVIRRAFPNFHVYCRVKLRTIAHPFYVRLGTTDYNCLHQIFFQRDYDLPYVNCDGDEVYILDAGANVGYAAIFFQQLFPHSQIISIESDYENYKVAKRNLSPYARCNVVNAALWDKNTVLMTCDGTWGDGGEWARQVREYDGECSVGAPKGVPAFRLDDLVRRYQVPSISILKMDIEGAEHRVINSLDKSVLSLIENAAVEFHGGDVAARQKLIDHGFEALTSGETTFFTRSSNACADQKRFNNCARFSTNAAVG